MSRSLYIPLMNTTDCTRCKGKGSGDWVVQYGICWGCNGKGTREAQLAIKAQAAADEKRRAEVETVSILIGPVASRRDAVLSFARAMGWDHDAALPFFEEVHPGWFAAEARLHWAETLASLAS